MPTKNLELLEKIRGQVRFHAKEKIDEWDQEDLVQNIFIDISRKEDQIRSLPSYISTAAKNRVYSYLKKRSRQPVDQIENIDGLMSPAENADPEAHFDKKEVASKSFLQNLKEKRPDFYESMEKSIDYVALLYFLKRNQSLAERYIIPYIKSMNALKEAKAKIEGLAHPLPLKVMKSLWKKLLKVRPLPPGWPDYFSDIAEKEPLMAMEDLRRSHEGLTPYPKQLKEFNRDYFFYVDVGWKISKKLEDQIDELQKAVAFELSDPGILYQDFSPWNLKNITELDDWIMDSIPQLRADPSMLLLRIFYRIFKIRAGRYSARTKIKEVLLEFANKNRKTYLQEIFKNISEHTSFETLRKKLYQKGARDIYGRLADFIYLRSYPDHAP